MSSAVDVYGLGGSDTSDTPVVEGAGGVGCAGGGQGAPDFDSTNASVGMYWRKNKNDNVCIGLHWCLYWSAFGIELVCTYGIGILLVHVLASVLAHIEKIGMYLVCICRYNYFVHTNTNAIYANTCWYV